LLLLIAVGVYVLLGGLRRQLCSVQMMSVRKVRVVRTLFVIATLVVFRRSLVMVSRALMVFGGFVVKFCGTRRHRLLLFGLTSRWGQARECESTRGVKTSAATPEPAVASGIFTVLPAS
jgi:hypothetical protein